MFVKNIEKDIEDLKKYISFASKSENFSHDTEWEWHKEVAGKIENILKENEKQKEQIDFILKNVENMEEENKRLKKENKDTLKIKVNLDNFIYEVDTQLKNKWELKELNYYYLADSNINPTKVKFIDWNIMCGAESVLIMCACYKSNKIEYYHPSNLHKNAKKASEEYLRKKMEIKLIVEEE